jgi:hypothetical protein
MKAELVDYMVGHESKSGTGARYGKRQVVVLAQQMALFPRFKVPAINRPPAPHKRVAVRPPAAKLGAGPVETVRRRSAVEHGSGAAIGRATSMSMPAGLPPGKADSNRPLGFLRTRLVSGSCDGLKSRSQLIGAHCRQRSLGTCPKYDRGELRNNRRFERKPFG